MSQFTIMVDTGCDFHPDLIREHDIRIVPITFDIDGKVYEDGYWGKIPPKEFYDALRNGAVAKTAQVNPETFYEIFKGYAGRKENLIYLTLSSALSGTYSSAQIALREIKETYPDSNIFIIDSISATVGIGSLVVMLAKKRSEGMSAGRAAEWMENKKHSFIGLFTVDDLMYLHRGGRLGKMSAIAGSIIQVKPLLNLTPEGGLELKDKVRGRKASMTMLIEQMQRCFPAGAPIGDVFITHTDCAEDAEALAEMLSQTVKTERIIISVMGPIIGAHVGPGALILAFDSPTTRQAYEAKYYGKK